MSVQFMPIVWRLAILRPMIAEMREKCRPECGFEGVPTLHQEALSPAESKGRPCLRRVPL